MAITSVGFFGDGASMGQRRAQLGSTPGCSKDDITLSLAMHDGVQFSQAALALADHGRTGAYDVPVMTSAVGCTDFEGGDRP